MNTVLLSGSLFADMVRGGAANLNESRNIVNDLNVFPIPDGDTGDNMFMTINSGFAAVSGKEGSLCDVSSEIAKGMLLGARGNSGVILSRIFAGIAKGFLLYESADLYCLAKAFESGVEEAYKAVSVPVEGTILTVYKDSVCYANSRINGDTTIENYFDDLISEMKRSLERTPDLLDVLKEAGVVDSGGAGFVYIAEGMNNVLLGKEVKLEEGKENAKSVDISLFTEDSVLEFGYCTEFILRLQNSKIDVDSFDETEIKDRLNEVGESLVFFRDGSIIKVHVHTMTPGDILNYCQNFGEFLTLKIENMTLQHNESGLKEKFEVKRNKAHKKYAVVTVASGKGIKETFSSLGADVVVEGGQSMNPSAEDFIKAFDELYADTIFVFPNNSNIVMTARQAADMYDKAEVRVIRTKTIGEGYAAISMLDTSLESADEIEAETEEIISSVVTGMVSIASRDTEKNGVNVKCGEYIGFADDIIYSESKNAVGAAEKLCEKLSAEKYDVMLLICGKDAQDNDAQALYNNLSEKYKRTEIIMINGGQPIYDYIIVLE